MRGGAGLGANLNSYQSLAGPAGRAGLTTELISHPPRRFLPAAAQAFYVGILILNYKITLKEVQN